MRIFEALWRALWVLLILANVYDLVFSAVAWKMGHGLIEENFFVSIFQYYGGINIPFDLELMTMIGVKLLFFTGIYWYTKLFDLLKASKYKWTALIPFIAISIFVDVADTFIFFHIPLPGPTTPATGPSF
ncbi:hypothetical protein [Metallosphaera hakonensis]|uniref:DUF5658 domain-containing protein n=1 Tax=Metallosphaera hakonensis JCM 8857 = DSM 7519 TaxID=1293036 RepID=A0A2U9IWV3_9CREN|nr:hypothetical protein [Metallosphaera hakonensis]AWS00591.1 hypothetical protein DFR87_06225 [Metallosphaera hakonensis JCM 8857 = DSM 7519]